MFPTRKQGLTMSDFFSCCSSLQDFNSFVNNVELQYSETKPQLVQYTIKRFKIQAVIPLKKLCMRYIQQLNIYLDIHLELLKWSIKLSFFDSLIQIVQSKAIPYKMQAQQSIQLDYLKFVILFKLGQYKKSLLMIKKTILKVIKEPLRQEKITKYLNCYLMISRLDKAGVYFEKEVLKRAYAQETESHIFNSFQIKGSSFRPQRTDYNLKKLKLFESLYAYATRSPQVDINDLQLIVNSDNTQILFQIYNLAKGDKLLLRQQVQSFKNDKYERVGLSQIKQYKLNLPENMIKINEISNISKYDCKEKILYLNHDETNTKEINQLISSSYALNQSIKSIIQVKDSLSSKLSMFSGIDRIKSLGIGGIGSIMGFDRHRH